MSATTTYDINVRYKLEDRASKGAAKIGTSLEKTARHGRNLLSTMKVVAAGAVVGFGFRAGKKWLIDYNASLQDTKLAMTGLMQLNLGGSWAENQAKASTLMTQFREDAKSSAGTMQDFAQFAQMIVGPVTRAKMSMQDLRDITDGGVVAAKAFGMQADVAARDIEQALAGTLGMKDRFARAILEPMGITTKAWNKMMKETPKIAARTLVKAFNQPALKKMAEGFKHTWSGATSTLKDNLQQTLGKVGMPLMKALTEEVRSMNAYFEKNPQKIAKFIGDFSSGLVKGFGYVKDVVKFIADHSSMLLTIAKAFIGFKLIQGAGGLLAGPFDMIAAYSGRMKAASSATTTFSQKATLAANKMQAVGTMLGVVYAGASALAGLIDGAQERELERTARLPQGLLASSVSGEQTGDRARKTVAYARDAGVLDPTGKASLARFLSKTSGTNISEKELKGKFDKWINNPTVKQRLQNSAIAFKRETGRNPSPITMTSPQFAETVAGATPGAMKSWKGLLAALEVDRIKKAKDQELFAQQFSSEIKAAGGLLSLYAKQRTGDKEFNMMSADRRFVGPTGAGDYTETEPKATKKNGDVKVYINTIKVASSDPDRFAVHMIGAFKNANTKPVASRLRRPGMRPA